MLDAIRRLRPGFTVEGFVREKPYKDPGVLSVLAGDLRAAGLG